jgi:hypothetical protein
MKRFVIKSPKPGRTTVTIVAHQYDPASLVEGRSVGRTRTIYLGSFSLGLDPDRLLGLERIGPGQCVEGVSLSANTCEKQTSFTLVSSDLSEIRSWLLEHGTFATRQAAERRALETAESAAVMERERFTAQLEVEIRLRLEQEWLDAFKVRLQEGRRAPLDALSELLASAGRHVISEAETLRSSGQRLTRIRSPGEVLSPLDALLARTLSIRRLGFKQFEIDCKAAGLMTKKAARKRAG